MEALSGDLGGVFLFFVGKGDGEEGAPGDGRRENDSELMPHGHELEVQILHGDPEEPPAMLLL